MMTDYCFSFLEDRFPRVALEAKACEKYLVLKDYEGAVLRAGIACEYISERICAAEDKHSLGRLGHAQRLEQLGMFNIIPGEIYRYFSSIRKLRNIVAHGRPLLDPLKDAQNVHAKLFKIAIWFFKTYGNEDGFVASEYNGPIYSGESTEDIVNKIKPELDGLRDEINKVKNEFNSNNTPEEQEGSIIEEEIESNLEDYLLNNIKEVIY